MFTITDRNTYPHHFIHAATCPNARRAKWAQTVSEDEAARRASLDYNPWDVHQCLRVAKTTAGYYDQFSEAYRAVLVKASALRQARLTTERRFHTLVRAAKARLEADALLAELGALSPSEQDEYDRRVREG